MPTPASSTYSLPASKDSGSVDTDAETPAAPISVPDTGDHGEGGKLKMIVQLVKRVLGVKDIAAMRLSLPASLLEPIPNLEYWNYLDRPDLFAAINDPDDQFQRMLAVIRFTFTKELKYVKGRVVKPYNSVLGEHFRAYSDVPTHAVLMPTADSTQPPILSWHLDDSGPQPPVVAVDSHLKSPSSAMLSAKSIDQPAVLGDHINAKSSPNLVVGSKSVASSTAPSIYEDTPTPGAPHRVILQHK
jgi:oxysterol-binding protein-related protein 9/10/11